VALGLHWQVRPSFGIDAGWIHFFPRTAVVDNSLATADDPILIAFTTTGLVTANVNVIGIQLTWQQSPPPIVN
jgi:long-subunit fatty acid transport protein